MPSPSSARDRGWAGLLAQARAERDAARDLAAALEEDAAQVEAAVGAALAHLSLLRDDPQADAARLLLRAVAAGAPDTADGTDPDAEPYDRATMDRLDLYVTRVERESARALVAAALALHRPVYLYDPQEWAADGGDGPGPAICRTCCCDADGGQDERCADHHLGSGPCWPCPTAKALGVEE